MTTSDDQPTPGELPDYGSVPPPSPGTPSASEAVLQQNKKASWSLVLGIIGLLGLCCTIGGFLGIPAVVLGILGRSEIEASNGTQTGSGMAIAGIVTGAIAALAAIDVLIVFAVDGSISGNLTVG
ncbi:DUF4190 domain-containing protein [Aeromicrobium sp.]|uniref:DUF4190 domain-containing protein n=1 Tax=Aeromicrobium sp. TaxID=1871063 RepID=UPI002FCAD257